MVSRRFAAATAISVVVMLTASAASAQVYVSDQFGQFIFQFGQGETAGAVINPDAPLAGIQDMELDGQGRLLIARDGNVLLFDPADQSVQLLDEVGMCSGTFATYPDGASNDVYLVGIYGCTEGRPELQYLPDGIGPAQTAVVFEESEKLVDVQVWPFGDRAGNILVLSSNPPFMGEVERTGPTTFARLDNVFDATHENFRGFSITPDGDILVIDFNDGLFRVEDGALIPYGEPIGPQLQDVSAGADGTIYVTDSYDNVVHRFDAGGTLILPPMGAEDLVTPRAVVAAGFTPTPAGENVPTSPAEDVDIFFEQIVQGGFTSAAVLPSTERVSPGGNYLPEYVEPPGEGDQFLFFDIGTESVYSLLIQVEIWMEGTRMFFAHGTQDTFRDVTIEGPIDDARGTIGRFSEIVLVEDMRPLSTVAEYKFRRLLKRVKTHDYVGTDECPDGGLKSYRKAVRTAKREYDKGNLTTALEMLGQLNMTIRDNAGWCTPDTYPDNVAGELLALSKTLMFSIEQLMPPTAGKARAVQPARLALAATSPVGNRSLVEFTGPAGLEVSARVYSASGRLVSTLFEGPLSGDSERVFWDGTDGAGERAASGVYFVRLEAAGESLSSKVVLIR